MRNGRFKAASMDGTAKAVTVLVIIAAGVFPLLRGIEAAKTVSLIVTILLPVTLFATWLFSVTGYELKDGILLVLRPLWKTEIELPADVTVHPEPEIRKGFLKIAGNGGLFGYTGWFRNKNLGRFRAYATNLNHAVSLTGDGNNLKIVLSPENADEFMGSFR